MTNEVRLTVPRNFALWERLRHLSSVAVLTAAQEIERLALARWLDPKTSDVLRLEAFTSWAKALPIAASRDLAEGELDGWLQTVWSNLALLAIGSELPPEPARSADEISREWWRSTMATLEGLLSSGEMLGGAFVGMTTCHQYRRGLYEEIGRELFGGLAPIGANLYWRSPFGDHSQLVDPQAMQTTIEALSFAVAEAADAMRLTSGDLNDSLRQLSFFWRLLQGYLWAGSQDRVGMKGHLLYLFAEQEGLWGYAKSAFGEYVLLDTYGSEYRRLPAMEDETQDELLADPAKLIETIEAALAAIRSEDSLGSVR